MCCVDSGACINKDLKWSILPLYSYFTKLQPNELRSLSPLSNIDLEAHSAGKSGFKSSVVF